METRKIGTLDASVVGLGCNNFGWHIDEAETGRVVDAALDAGVSFFDTADIYGGTKSEAIVSVVRRAEHGSGGVRSADALAVAHLRSRTSWCRRGA